MTTVAVVGPLSGIAGHLGLEMRHAAELAADHADAAATGIALEAVDDRGDVATGASVAETLAARPDVVAVVGHFNADVTLAAAGVYDQHGVPMVTPIAANPELTELGRPTTFRFCNRNDRTALAIATHLRVSRGKRRAAVIATTTAYGRSMAQEFAAAFERLGGSVVFSATVDEGQSDVDREVAGVPADADVLFYGGSFEGATILRALRRRGNDILFAAGDGCWDREGFLIPAGDACAAGEGVLVLASAPQPDVVAGAARVAAAFAARHGPPGNYALNTYDATTIVLAAIRRAGHPVTREAVLTAIRETRHEGVAYPAPSRWDAKGDNLATVTALNVVRDGEFVTIDVIPNHPASSSRRPVPLS